MLRSAFGSWFLIQTRRNSLGLFLGPIGVGGGEVLDIGEGLLVLADLQVKLRK